ALPAAVEAYAAELAAAAPIAVRMVKRAIYRGLAHDLTAAVDLESLQQRATFQTEDAKEGIRAIMEKRAPVFTGR
ncbi:MAG TPA: enoyl-CoA hydratase-related protein, partial [Candidatus Dormibacteraeota bacterium]|nr:enoyl-CoA hydratase-related protein [Candidatus Dormibacteraeota bacterium]